MKCLKTLLIITFFLLAGSQVFGQDLLIYNNNEVIKVKVLKITDTEISYKLFSNPDGPLYNVNRSNVSNIIYENGVAESFNTEKQFEREVADLKDNKVRNGEIDMRVGFWGLQYTINGEKAKTRDVVNMMRRDTYIYDMFKKGKSLGTLSNVFSYTGFGLFWGGVVLWGATDSHVIGVPVMGLGVSFNIVSQIVGNNAVTLLEASIGKYNANYAQLQEKKAPLLTFGITSNGVGVIYHLK